MSIVIAKILNPETHEVRAYTDDSYDWEGDTRALEFQWTDGNYGCDCNRSRFWLRAGGATEAEVDAAERPCGGRWALVSLTLDGHEVLPAGA